MTNNELRFPDDRPDREIGDALRPSLAPPGEGSGSYWGNLELRIMQRINEERSSPWSVLATWRRPAAIAAALLLAAASVALTQMRHEEAAVAYGAIAEEQFSVAEPSAPPTAGADVTVRMLLEH
jgi:anti-sigma-K factor RskA